MAAHSRQQLPGRWNARRILEARVRPVSAGINISYYLPTSAVAFAALYYNQADLVMGHKPGFYDLLAYQRVMGFDPLEVTAVTGSFDVAGWENSTVILVNQDCPLKGITMQQLDGVFGPRATAAGPGPTSGRTGARDGQGHPHLGSARTDRGVGGQADPRVRIQSFDTTRLRTLR